MTAEEGELMRVRGVGERKRRESGGHEMTERPFLGQRSLRGSAPANSSTLWKCQARQSKHGRTRRKDGRLNLSLDVDVRRR